MLFLSQLKGAVSNSGSGINEYQLARAALRRQVEISFKTVLDFRIAILLFIIITIYAEFRFLVNVE